MNDQKFCMLCGAPLHEVTIENRIRQACTVCDWVYYPQLKVSAGTLVEESGNILLVQRSIDPWKGFWYLPAGYLEDDEDPILGAERETCEETGLVVGVTGLREVSMYEDDPRGNGILILYNASRRSGQLKNGNESLRVGFFSPEQVEDMPLAGSSHTHAIMNWVEEKKRKGSY